MKPPVTDNETTKVRQRAGTWESQERKSGQKHSIRKHLTAVTVMGLATANIGWADAMVSVPVWLIVVFSALALTVVGAATLVAWKCLRKPDAGIERPTTAQIFGIRWRWSYDQGTIREIAAFCPKCDQPVGPTAEARHGFLHLISYKCSCGKWRSKSFQCSQEDFIDRVCHTIQQGGAGKTAGRAVAS